MDYKYVEKKDFSGKKVKVLDETYDSGAPECVGCGSSLGWRGNWMSKEDKLKYLKYSERYWYNDDWYGSEAKK